MRKTLALVLVALTTSGAHAQLRNANWIFGWGIWLDFNSWPPVLQPGPIGGSDSEDKTSLSDPNGDLLFYSEAWMLVDANMAPLAWLPTIWPQLGFIRSSIAVPKPGSEYEYIFFATGQYPGPIIPFHLAAMTIDMSLNGGLGEVSSPVTVLSDSCTTKIGATTHSNGTDYWVVAHQLDTDAFFAYAVTSAGVDTIPTISHTGAVHLGDDTLDTHNWSGNLKFTVHGDLLAVSSEGGIIELFYLDQATGEVEFIASIEDIEYSLGMEFSATGNMLYATNAEDPSTIEQFSLDILDQAAINASRTTVYSTPLTVENPLYTSMALAPDGRIYFNRRWTHYMSYIAYPDLIGAACEVHADEIDVTLANPNAETQNNLPNQCKRYHDSEMSVGLAPSAQNTTYALRPNPMADASWLATAGLTGAVTLEWLDATGRVIRSESAIANGHGIPLQRGSLSNGVYALHVVQQGRSVGTARAVLH